MTTINLAVCQGKIESLCWFINKLRSIEYWEDVRGRLLTDRQKSWNCAISLSDTPSQTCLLYKNVSAAAAAAVFPVTTLTADSSGKSVHFLLCRSHSEVEELRGACSCRCTRARACLYVCVCVSWEGDGRIRRGCSAALQLFSQAAFSSFLCEKWVRAAPAAGCWCGRSIRCTHCTSDVVSVCSQWRDFQLGRNLFMLLNIKICRPQSHAVTSQHAAGWALAVASKMSLLEANKYIYLSKPQDIYTVL